MIAPTRQSILNRPARKCHPHANQETVDLEHHSNVVKLQIKQSKREELNDERRRAFVGTREERTALQAERRRAIDAHLEVRSGLKTRDRAHDLELARTLALHEKYTIEAAKAQEATRRAALREAMETNRRLAAERSAKAAADREAERQRERTLAAAGEFFDRTPRSFA
eukprot:TRINITY_DN11631_c0_g1_i1.p1 TRINITY_DN11631_c0_g1~~TRINITY_DN11631_c0_g1_i1.p1  ORF type:complete len:179 (+),score=49.75 TRINITY_DN11631_c0_g1_i1:34-537(+)